VLGLTFDVPNVKNIISFCGRAAFGTNQKWKEQMTNVVSQVLIGLCPMSSASAGLRPYPNSKESASELIRSGIKASVK